MQEVEHVATRLRKWSPSSTSLASVVESIKVRPGCGADLAKMFPAVTQARSGGACSADLCFVPASIVFSWFEGADIVPASGGDSSDHSAPPIANEKGWGTAFASIRCPHGRVNPLAVWTNAAKVLPRWVVDYIVDSPTRKNYSPTRGPRIATGDQFVKPVHGNCCAVCTDLLWKEYGLKTALPFVVRGIFQRTQEGTSAEDLEAFLWQVQEGSVEDQGGVASLPSYANNPSTRDTPDLLNKGQVRNEAGYEWTWFPRELWVTLFQKPSTLDVVPAGDGGGSISEISPPSEERLFATINDMCGFSAWVRRHTEDGGKSGHVVDPSPAHNWLGLSSEAFLDQLATGLKFCDEIDCKHSKSNPKFGGDPLADVEVFDEARGRGFQRWVDPASVVVLLPRDWLRCYVQILYGERKVVEEYFGHKGQLRGHKYAARLRFDPPPGVVPPCSRCAEALRRKTVLFLAAKYPERMPQCPLNRLPAEILGTIAKEFL